MDAAADTFAAGTEPNEIAWFMPCGPVNAIEEMGFRRAPGGVHLSKTMMLSELGAAVNGASQSTATDMETVVLVENVLAKSTGTARKIALSRLNTLYGVVEAYPLQAAMLRLWPRNVAARPLLALLCCLARESLLRSSAWPILAAPMGAPLHWPDLAKAVEAHHPGRYSPKMLKSLAQNCASSWTQAGHLQGKINKCRAPASPTPEVAAYAALLGELAGFGGPALLRSPWMAILDRADTDLLTLLRSAESLGLTRIRAGGGVVQISTCRPMADLLEIPELANR